MDKNIIREAKYIISNNKTLREASLDLGISKSALHRHMTNNLKKIDYDLYLEIKNLFLEHTKIRHIKGGISTKMKYLKR